MFQSNQGEELMEIGLMFNKYFKGFQNRRNSSMLKADALSFLIKNPNSTMSSLSKHLDSTQPAVTKLIDTMLLRHLVTKKIDIKDKRNILLTITKEGEEELKRIKKIMAEEMQKIYEVLTQEELEMHIIIQKKLVEQMVILMNKSRIKSNFRV